MDGFNSLINSELPTLVDFFAPWCGPCRMQAPIIDELERRMAGRANFLKVDIDESPGLASRFGVKSVPTLLLFRGGELVWRAVGLQQIDELETAVARYSDAKDKDCIS